ncbi:MAG: hypothetical protein PVH12_02085 [Candidatus Bathyarchaeota archaeon]
MAKFCKETADLDEVVVKGSIYRIYDQRRGEKAGARWWPEKFMVTLRTRNSGTFYMPFRTKEEMLKLCFAEEEKVVVKGRLWAKEVRRLKKRILLCVERISEKSSYVTYE